MRLIDADVAIEELTDRSHQAAKRVGTDSPFWEGLVIARRIVNNLPTIQPEPTWIPCSERLPSHDEYIKNNGLFIVSDGNRSYSEWYDIYDKRKFGEPTMSGFRIDYAVTAWMPLPEPYRGGEK